MSNRFVNIGESILVECARRISMRGIVDLTISLTIQRKSDLAYWTGSGWSTITVLTMTQVDKANKPGLYKYDGPTPTVVDIYFCHCYIASGQYAFQSDETLESMLSVSDALTAFDVAKESTVDALPTLSEMNAGVIDVNVVSVADEEVTGLQDVVMGADDKMLISSEDAAIADIKGDGFVKNTDSLVNLSHGSGSLTPQEVRDAMSLAPTSDTPAINSIDSIVRQIKSISMYGLQAGKIKYVTKAGVDSNSGDSFNSPYLTIAAATAALVDGGILFIGDGSWQEDVTIPANIKVFGTYGTGYTEILGLPTGSISPTLIVGYNSEINKVRIGKQSNSGGNLKVISMLSGSKIKNSMTGNIASLSIPSIISMDGTGVNIEDNVLSGNGNVEHAVSGNPVDGNIINNTIESCSDDYINISGSQCDIIGNSFIDIPTGKYGVNITTISAAVMNNSHSGAGRFINELSGTNIMIQNNEQWLNLDQEFMGIDDETLGDFFKRLNWSQVRPRNADIIAAELWEFFYPVGSSPTPGGIGAQMKRKLQTYNGGVPSIANDNIARVFPTQVV